MGKKVVIVGGGVGGTIVANQLARRLRGQVQAGEVEVTQISATDQHMYQPGLLFVTFNLMQPEELFRDQRSLLQPGVRFVHDTVTGIDRDRHTVTTRSGAHYSYDLLVISTGSRLAPETIPGLSEAGHWFYDLDHAVKLRDTLQRFEGGKIVIAVGVPHKCPVAPLEVTFMLDEWLRQRGLRDKTELTYTYPIGRLHSLEPVANWAVGQFAARGIESEVLFNMESIDPDQKEIHTLEGSRRTFDLLIAIPPHKGSQLMIDSGLGDTNGWVATNRHSLQMEGAEDIFVLGDTTNLPISKAGSTAHYEADVVVENIISTLRGGPASHRYDGKVYCFIETGLDKATYAAFDYQNPPKPPTPSALIHWFKLGYNQLYWQTVKGVL